MKKNKLTTKGAWIIPILILTAYSSCTDFIQADLSRSIIEEDVVFNNDITATSAVVGIYSNISNFSPLSGTSDGMAALLDLYAEEQLNYSQTPALLEYHNHSILVNNTFNTNLWNYCFNIIYQANAVIAGLEKSTGVSTNTKKQLMGEALFLRSFVYFYLVNIYGDVPILKGTDYKINSTCTRNAKNDVYEFVIDDLKQAKNNLNVAYPTIEKVRPNKYAAAALLAKVYLFNDQVADADRESSEIINSNIYPIAPTVSSVFDKNGSESIWQLMPVYPYYNTVDASYFIITSTPYYNYLNPDFVDIFDVDDERLKNWIGEYTNELGTFYFPYKYKALYKDPTAEFAEYATVFRISEVILIRAEARAKQNMLSEAISDLDMIKSRAGVPLIKDVNPTIDKDGLLSEILGERQKEFFTEWGNRWLDLKRTGMAITSLSRPITTDQLLFPIPQIEFTKNPNLGIQNHGY